jgi:hypothetical protein
MTWRAIGLLKWFQHGLGGHGPGGPLYLVPHPTVGLVEECEGLWVGFCGDWVISRKIGRGAAFGTT